MSRFKNLIKFDDRRFHRLLIIITIIFILIIFGIMAVAINRNEPEYDRAIIFLDDGERIEGELEDYYGYGGIVEVTIDGTTYSLDRENVVLIIDED